MTVNALVARVISDREAVLNVGSQQGVKTGDIATVYRQTLVSDPATHEELGTVKRPAVRLQIVEVQDRLSVGQTFETVPVERDDPRVTRTSSVLADAFRMAAHMTVRITENRSAEDKSTIWMQSGWEASVASSPDTKDMNT